VEGRNDREGLECLSRSVTCHTAPSLGRRPVRDAYTVAMKSAASDRRTATSVVHKSSSAPAASAPRPCAMGCSASSVRLNKWTFVGTSRSGRSVHSSSNSMPYSGPLEPAKLSPLSILDLPDRGTVQPECHEKNGSLSERARPDKAQSTFFLG
jgi:hypothetical protein